MGRVKELYMDIENSAVDYLHNYLNDKDQTLQECKDNFEAEHGCGAMHIFDEIFNGAIELKMSGNKW